jgi:hypothetical protein
MTFKLQVSETAASRSLDALVVSLLIRPHSESRLSLAWLLRLP